MASKTMDVIVKWSGNEYTISDLSGNETVEDLKQEIQKQTGVLPHRQKLLGLKYKGKLPTDDLLLSTLQLKPKTKIMMMGTREEVLAVANQAPTDLPEVLDDFDIEEEEICIENREEYLTKIQRRIKDYTIDVISEPRVGKKLLVLDIDYTLFDHKSIAETGEELMRPFLHEFLESAYEDYDIAIWSATSMKWIKAKMEQLGVLSSTRYSLSFMIDSLAMITVDTGEKYGIIEVKPLAVIWGKFEQYNKDNTIMFDDLRRNFIMNPQNGLKIRPFNNAHKKRHTDRELLKLARYLKDISRLSELSALNHRKWEKYRPKKTASVQSVERKEDDKS